MKLENINPVSCHFFVKVEIKYHSALLFLTIIQIQLK